MGFRAGAVRAWMAAVALAWWIAAGRGGAGAAPLALDTADAIQQAMKNAAPGDTLLVAPGVYLGDRLASGDPESRGLFYSGRSGTAAAPIVLASSDPARPAVLCGASVADGGYGIHLTGDHWRIQDLVVTRAQKGVVIDNGNHNVLRGLEVHDIGDEAVHFRDGSSYNVLEHSTIHDTGKREPGFGEGAYVGSDAGAVYEHIVIGNVIRNIHFAGGIPAEHVDIKEGADGTVVEHCTFDGNGISGANSADSFVDVKGVNSEIRFNRGARNGNARVVDAFQVRTHGSGHATGVNNRFHHNVVDLDGVIGFVVHATSATRGTVAHDDVRVGGGNLYSANVQLFVAARAVTWGELKARFR